MKNILENLAELESKLRDAGNIGIGLDYDGTLSPIAPTPDEAVLAMSTRAALKNLAADSRYKTAIVTGRAVWKIKEILDIPGIAYIGNHGFEIESPEFSRNYNDAAWQKKLEAYRKVISL